MKLLHKVALTVGAMVASTGAMAQAVVDPYIATAASNFSDTYALNAAEIGGVLITGAFIAIGIKWAKGTIFS